jgi:hypothetical protein
MYLSVRWRHIFTVTHACILLCRERVAENMDPPGPPLAAEDKTTAEEIAGRRLSSNECRMMQRLLAEVDSHGTATHKSARVKLLERAVGLVLKIEELKKAAPEDSPPMLNVRSWTSKVGPPLFRLNIPPGNPKHRSIYDLRTKTKDPLYRELLAAQVRIQPLFGRTSAQQSASRFASALAMEGALRPPLLR